jgi:hypothetical protein
MHVKWPWFPPIRSSISWSWCGEWFTTRIVVTDEQNLSAGGDANTRFANLTAFSERARNVGDDHGLSRSKGRIELTKTSEGCSSR